MKRLISAALFGAVCFLAGYMFSPHAGAAAQGQAAQAPLAAPGPPATRVVNGKGMYFPIDEIKKKFRRRTRTATFPRATRGPRTTWRGLPNTASLL
jgi:hypothetical protein